MPDGTVKENVPPIEFATGDRDMSTVESSVPRWKAEAISQAAGEVT